MGESCRKRNLGAAGAPGTLVPTLLVEYAPELRAIESNWPKIKFHALREHAGLVFQRRLEG